MPRQIETVEAFAVCGWPGRVRDQWYEFTGHGFGLLGADCGCGNTLIERDPGPTFDWVRGTTKKLRLYSDETEADDAWVLVQGYDENSNWIRTDQGGVLVDGEYMLPTIAGATSTSIFTAVTGIIKPITVGTLRLFEYDPATAVQKALGVYEPDETRPHYRRYLVPGLGNVGSSGEDCTTTSVTVVAKLRHIPVRLDNDWLILGNVAALRFMVQAIDKERKNLIEEAAAYEATATRLLEEELSSYQGDGMVTAVRVAPASEWGGGIVNYIS
ncbi:MAG TPA: hypothetical protein VFO36_08260 [Nitrospiraceae bacterium]|nr:hypothetical protein [Nitrospiraceae bacterium]